MAKENTDPAMTKVLRLFEQSGKSLEQLGQEMGYTGETARKAAWQFITKSGDPRISMLRRFARAMGVSIEELVGERKKKGHDNEP
jgi:transcriptional regulator with XRE-family HTH domain